MQQGTLDDAERTRQRELQQTGWASMMLLLLSIALSGGERKMQGYACRSVLLPCFPKSMMLYLFARCKWLVNMSQKMCQPWLN
jgi:hypothetical protein